MKIFARISLLLILTGTLWLSITSTFGQTPSNKTPHLAYGQSVDVTLVNGIPTTLWLDVTSGDTFTVNIQGNGRVFVRLNVDPATEILPFNWKQTDTASALVYTTDNAGPYLLSLTGEGATTVSLAQGDTLSVDRGPIAMGDTVTGTGSEMQVDAYSIDLPANSDFTLRLTSEGRGSFPILLLPGLRDALQVDRYGDGAYAQYYVIPAELAGLHQILVRMNDSEYTLSVIAGNDLFLDKGTLAPDTPISTIGTAGKTDRYSFEATQGQVVTFVLESAAGWDAYIETRAEKGLYLDKVTDGATSGGYFQTYSVSEAGPYSLYVQTEGDYTLTLFNGPYLEGVPSVKVGDTVEVPNTGTTQFVLDAAEGTWVTIETIGDGAGINRIELDDAAGNGVYPVAVSSDNPQGIYRALFHLQGPVPYLFEINGGVAYTLSVSEGDTVRTDAGEITVEQSVEGAATVGETILYTLPSVETGQSVAIVQSGTSGFSLYDANGERVEYFHFYYPNTDTAGNYVTYSAYQLDGLCPCQLQLVTNQPNYTLEVMPIIPDEFPVAQPLNLGEAVSGDTGEALILPYTFEATSDGDLAIRLEFDPTLTDGSKLYLEVQTPGEGDPRYLILDHSQTEVGKGYLVQHYPLYFSGEYTLRIKNLHGPYILTTDIE